MLRKDKVGLSDMSAVADNKVVARVVAALLDSQVVDSEGSWDSSGRPSSAFSNTTYTDRHLPVLNVEHSTNMRWLNHSNDKDIES